MIYGTIDDLRSQLGGGSKSQLTPEYRAKQLHELPKAETVDRMAFILKHCAGKRVLEFGASGALHEEIKKVVADYAGVDRDRRLGVMTFDLDDVTQPLPDITFTKDDDSNRLALELSKGDHSGLVPPDLIVCGEVLEHLGNPLHFLTRLKKQYAGIPVIITVPNAYASGSLSWLNKGIENVNGDHVAWYSPKTLSVLLSRAGYTVGGLFYYNGVGPTAEGMVVVTE